MPNIPFERFRKAALDLYPESGYASASIRAVIQILRELDELHIQGRKLVKTSADINESTISAWVRSHSDRSPVRNRTLLRTLRPLTKFAVKKGYLTATEDPFRDRTPHKWAWPGNKAIPKSSPFRARSPQQIGGLLHLLDEEARTGTFKALRLRALAYAYAFTGLRKNEILELPVACVDLEHRALRIVASEEWAPKTIASAGAKPMADQLAAVMTDWLPHTGSPWVFPGVRRKGPWTSGAPGTKALDEMKAAAKRAGIEGWTILGFRKSLATHATFMGISDEERRRQLGHASIETAVNWYEEPLIEEMRPSVNKIHYPAPAEPPKPHLRVISA